MNFKNNIERCETAQDMGYRVQLLKNDGWHTNECIFILPATQYRVHPDDEEAFEADLAAREDAARRQTTLKQCCTVEKQAIAYLEDQIIRLRDDYEQRLDKMDAKYCDQINDRSTQILALQACKADDMQTIADQAAMIERLKGETTIGGLLKQLRDRTGPNTEVIIRACED